MKKTKIIFLFTAFILSNEFSFSQISNITNNATAGTEYVGWSNAGVSKELDIKNNSSTIKPIDFYIQNNMFLEVLTSGDLRIVNGSNGYKINSDFVLWHNNNATDIFVGVNSGNATMTGHSNTLVGNGAGASITTSEDNVAVGTSAAASLTSGESNTAVGESAANALTTGEHNTAVGYDALASAVDLHWNTAVGYEALSQGVTCPLCLVPGHSYNTAIGYQALKNSQAYGGVAVGYHAATLNSSGCSIVAVGENALYSNSIGNSNVGIGPIH